MDGLAFLVNGNAQQISGGGGVEEGANLVVVPEEGTGQLWQLRFNTRRVQGAQPPASLLSRRAAYPRPTST